ncbi:threonine/serine exporter ThrE family protein [Promicromonospora citrea]|uniref:Membrane protein n=1 Tax=Promicromonospora citrea TaxID=43677 RepID=A0A8H9L491_9MICO|nr:threonine/serine exporter family protein [Promicromonospora citrea]NNH54824.1 threonine/serine exporter family protein [Promicromonospora citrea]GGM24944.1 membrane protein [Promicromonospora citrea]
MPQPPRRSLYSTVRHVLRADPADVPDTEVQPAVDDAMVLRALDLAMRVGEQMFAVGASAHEVTLAVTRVAEAYGLHGVHVDVTYTSIALSYQRSGEGWPHTLLRVVRVAAPDHTKLQRLQALLVDIDGGLDLDEARARFRAIRRVPFRYRPQVVVVARALLTVGVSILSGGTATVAALTFVAALAAASTQSGLARLRVPSFFSQIAGAFVTTVVAVAVSALAAAGVEPFTGIRPSIIVASGIVLMLSGLTVVGAAQDAIDGFALTAAGRILDLTLQTLGLVVGILAGLELGSVLGYRMTLPDGPLPLGPLPGQVAGAVIIAVSVALFNGAGLRIVVISALLGSITALGYDAAASLAGLHVAAASGVAALVASFVGVLVAHNLHVPSVAVTTAAIVPLVPGGAVFYGLLGMVHADPASGAPGGASSLVLAASVGLALAAGASLGIYLGTPVRATLESVARSRARVRR